MENTEVREEKNKHRSSKTYMPKNYNIEDWCDALFKGPNSQKVFETTC